MVIDKGIKVYISPAFSEDLEPSQLEVKEGGEIRLSARVQAYPIVGIMWYRDGVSINIALFCIADSDCSKNRMMMNFA